MIIFKRCPCAALTATLIATHGHAFGHKRSLIGQQPKVPHFASTWCQKLLNATWSEKKKEKKKKKSQPT